LTVLDERLTAWLKEMSMDPAKIPMSRAARELMALWDQREDRAAAQGRALGLTEGLTAGRATGKREALVTLLGARGLAPTAKQKAAIEGCEDPAQIDRWIVKAATATTVAEVLAADAPSRPRPRTRPAKTVKTPSRAKRKTKRA
jgi:hypothetical protein